MPIARPEVIAFLQQIKEEPERDEHRLILADWLEEHGDPRGTFVRLQVEAARLPEDDFKRTEMEMQAQEIANEHLLEWIPTECVIFEHHRGLLSLMVSSFELSKPYWDELRGSELFAWVDKVSIRMESPDKTWVQRLNDLLDDANAFALAVQHPEAEIPTQLFRSKVLSQVRRLDLSGAQGSDKVIRVLAASERLSNVTNLDLHGNRIGDAGVRDLALSPHLRQVTHLDLTDNLIRNSGLRDLAATPYLTQLKSLRLGFNQYGTAGVEALAKSEALATLERFTGSGMLVNDRMIRIIAESTTLKGLRDLELNFGQIGSEGVQALAQSPNASTLKHLSLSENQIGDGGAFALASSPYLDNLQELVLTYNRIGWEGMDALRARFGDRVLLDSTFLA